MSVDLATRAPVGLALLTRDWGLIDCNATLADWLGEPPEQLRGRSLRSFMSMPAQIFVETHVDPLLAMQQRVREVALELVAKERMPVLLNADATPEGLHVALVDIRERRSYEEELRTSRRRAEADAARHALVADVGPRLVGALDMQETADVAAARAVPHLADACLVRAEADDAPVVAQAGASDLLAGVEVSEGLPPPAARQAAFPLGQEGRLGWIAYAWGIAHEPQEDLLREYSQLVALALDRAQLHAQARQEVTARETLIGVLGHEFASPLSALQLQVGMVRKFHSGALPAPVERLLGVVERNVEHMDRLVKDMLDLSRIRSGRFVLWRQPADLADVARATIERMQPFLASRDATVELEAEPAPCEVDPMRLQQVVANLVTNAVKYGAPPFEVHVEKDPDAVRLRVVDHGKGIPAEDRRRLFAAFERLGRSARGGTGLGLYIVRHMVAAHGGDIAVSETPGGGATFSITLPSHGTG